MHPAGPAGLELLKEHLPKECIPKDYGGEGPALREGNGQSRLVSLGTLSKKKYPFWEPFPQTRDEVTSISEL